MGNNILIINYVFPPYPGIGGRRWAKFAKYLHRKGNNVYIIASKNPFKSVSTFMNDIKDLPKENLFYLNPKYPTVLLKQPKNITDKLQYHFWIKALPLLTQGNFYDRSMLWKKQLQEKIKRIVNDKNIDTIIVSGPPFHYAYETMLLKKAYPHIKFIVDYRDEWTFNDVHGFGIIDDKRRSVEYEKEKFVCENADAVISCHEIVLDYLDSRYYIKRKELISHGFDQDDFVEISSIEKSIHKNDINISYFGTIYPGIKNFFVELIKCLDWMEVKNKELYSKLNFNFYSIDYFHYEDVIKKHQEKIKIIQKHLSPIDLFKEIYLSDFVLLLPSVRLKNNFTSKFPEIFYLQKPIILYSEDGKVSEFIKNKGIGIHLPKENFYDAFVNAIENPYQFNYSQFNINEWDYEYITQQLIQLMGSLN